VRALFRAVDVATKCMEATLGGCAGKGCAEIGVERERCVGSARGQQGGGR